MDKKEIFIYLFILIFGLAIINQYRNPDSIIPKDIIESININPSSKKVSNNYGYDPKTNRIVPFTILTGHQIKLQETKGCLYCHPDY